MCVCVCVCVCVYLCSPALGLGCLNRSSTRKPLGKTPWSCWTSQRLLGTWNNTNTHDVHTLNTQIHTGRQVCHLLKACSRSSSLLSVMLMNRHWTGRKLPSSSHWGGEWEAELWRRRLDLTSQLPGPAGQRSTCQTQLNTTLGTEPYKNQSELLCSAGEYPPALIKV